jgi:hypothetical protein
MRVTDGVKTGVLLPRHRGDHDVYEAVGGSVESTSVCKENV